MKQFSIEFDKEKAHLTTDEAISLYEKIIGSPDTENGEILPKYPPPPEVTVDQLVDNLKRWNSLRHTACIDMQGVAAMIESHGDAAWYFTGTLNQIDEIIEGGYKYDGASKLDPEEARRLIGSIRLKD